MYESCSYDTMHHSTVAQYKHLANTTFADSQDKKGMQKLNEVTTWICKGSQFALSSYISKMICAVLDVWRSRPYTVL